MSKDEILDIMEESYFRKVEVVDVNEEVFIGTVEMFESRADTSDDEGPCAGEALIAIDSEDDLVCSLYESDIKSIRILD